MTAEKLKATEWVEDECGWNLTHITELNLYGNKIVGEVKLLIEKRPVYCDRGHLMGKVFGLPSVDDADCFPRYYMSLEIAKKEMRDWLVWRLYKETDRR